MFVMSVKLSLVTLISLPLLLWATSLFRKKVRVQYRETRGLSRMNSFINENVTGVQTVKIFGQENRAFIDFDKINKGYYRCAGTHGVLLRGLLPGGHSSPRSSWR